jgi:hypothetical protein
MTRRSSKCVTHKIRIKIRKVVKYMDATEAVGDMDVIPCPSVA